MRLCPADSVSVCALIGVHLLIEERTGISCSPHVVRDTFAGHSIGVVGDWVDSSNSSCGDLTRRE